MFSVIFVMTTTATKFRAAFGLNNAFLHELVLTFGAEFTGVMIAITIAAYKGRNNDWVGCVSKMLFIYLFLVS